jgi:biofilm PGA synthesis protein PgaA
LEERKSLPLALALVLGSMLITSPIIALAQSSKALKETPNQLMGQPAGQEVSPPTIQMAAQPHDWQGWLASGAAARRNKEPFAALRAYAEALRLSPNQPEAKAAMVSVLRDLGAPFGAAGYTGGAHGLQAGEPPQITDGPLGVRAQQAVLLLRWATSVTPEPRTPRFAAMDKVLVLMDMLIAEARQDPEARDVLDNLRRDRVIALRQRERWADALVAFAGLQSDGVALPAYVQQARADALLALRRPEEAVKVYDQVIGGQQPDLVNRDAYVGRFYAEIESEDFKAAFSTVDTLASQGSAGKVNPGTGRTEQNIDWLSSQILAGQARSYGDMQADAWARLLPLADGAPALGYLRSAQASVAAARGWPRRAEAEIELAASLSPEDRGVRVGLADSALRRRDVPVARHISADLLSRSPEDVSVQRLVRDIALNDKAEFRFDVTGNRDAGNAGNAAAGPGGGLTLTSRLRSAPLLRLGIAEAENWRLQAAFERSTARPVEGLVVRNRVGAGAVYDGPDLNVEFMGWNNVGTLSRAGASVDATWQLTDQWSVSGGAERFAQDTPLRAVFYDIRADAVGASVQYRWHESRSLLLGLRTLKFSDGNRRVAQRLVFSQRLLEAPHFTLTVRPELYASQNSLRGVPYFNPAHDLSANLTLEAEHILYRRYEHSWLQRLRASAGRYAQSGFATASTASVAYEQVLQADPTLELRWGIELSRPVYDGRVERQTIWFAGVTKRF